MNLNVGNQGGLRRAALALHALGGDDREWLLQRLPAARESLQQLLAELRELDMPADAAVIRAALSEAPAITGSAGLQAAALCLVLQAEPRALQSLLLALLSDAERQSVLAEWPELQPLPAAIAQADWAPALREALLQGWREVASSAAGRPA